MTPPSSVTPGGATLGAAEGLAVDGLAAAADEVEALVHTDPAAADALAARTADAAAARDLPDLQARVTYVRARIHAERGDLDGALAFVETARALWESTGSSLSALRTDLGRMQILDDLGRHAEARQVGEAMLARLDERGTEDQSVDEAGSDGQDPGLATMLRAAALGNVGVACSFLADHERSLACYEESGALYAGLGMAVQVAQQRANAGIELLALGRAREALSALQQSQSELAAEGDPLWAAKCSVHVADAHRQLGEVVPALVTLHHARAELVALGAGAEEARAHVQLCRTQLEAGLVPEAVESARQAEALCHAASLAHDAAFARFVLASAHLRAGDFGEAQSEAERCVAAFDEVGDQQFRARALLLTAQVLVATGDPRGDAVLEDAVTLLEAGGWLVPLAWAYVATAERGPADAAAVARAVELADQLQIPALTLVTDVLRARACRAQDPDAAIDILRGTVARAGLRGRDLVDPLLRLAAQAEEAPAHDLLVDLLVTRGAPGDAVEALEASEASKAQTLRDLLAAAGPERRAPAARSADPVEHDDLRRDLDAAYTALGEAPAADERDALLLRAARLEGRLGSLRLEHAMGTPATDRGGAPPAATGTPAGPTLAFHVTGDDVVVFTVTADGAVSARRVPGSARRCAEMLDLLSAQWDRFAIGSGFVSRHEQALVRTTRAILANLHDELVGTGLDGLDGLDHTPDRPGRLWVVPHRLLHRVPFPALETDGEALTDRWAVTVAPLCPRRPTPDATAYAAPADPGPALPADAEVLLLAVPDHRAPAVAEEAARVRSLHAATSVLSEADATAAALRERLPGPAVVHLACHGLHRPDNPWFSGVRLADGWLRSSDVLDLDLGGALLVLSACESGEVGRRTAEPVGLAWAALAAGARGVIVSQWVLDDEVAVDLVGRLYHHLGSGLTTAEALREAQRELRGSHPHPYHWAALSHVAPPELISASSRRTP